MNVLFISYWGLEEGLTQATVIPHLRILSEMKEVERIQFVTIERGTLPGRLEMAKVEHHWLSTSHRVLDKVSDLKRMQRILLQINDRVPIDWILARTSLAARMVMKLKRKTGAFLSIESFEPHADYMAEDGIWKKGGLKYNLLDRSEQQQKIQSDALLPLTQVYRDHLRDHDRVEPAKMLVMPCCVDTGRFGFSGDARAEVRKELNISSDSVVGVYTGKYGGIYMSDTALDLFKRARDHFGDRFFLLILSPSHETWIEKLLEMGFPAPSFHAGLVAQPEVPQYLSAADFAFSLHRPTPSKMAISPIKNAEYLANGLPVIMPEGIGDDSKVVASEGLGVTFSADHTLPDDLFQKVETMLGQDRSEGVLPRWTRANRSFDIVRNHYQYILKQVR